MTTRPESIATVSIPGIPAEASDRLLEVLSAYPTVSGIWLFGSRAMERHSSGSDLDLCLDGPALCHRDRLRLMAEIDELLLPWQVDATIRSELPDELAAHVDRVGIRLWHRGA